jgi:hypothetical protein
MASTNRAHSGKTMLMVRSVLLEQVIKSSHLWPEGTKLDSLTKQRSY